VKSLFNELKRRSVFRVSIAYMVVSWVLLQVADLVLNNVGAPEWVMQTLILIMMLGLFAAVIISWAYEITPEGIKREKDIQRDDTRSHITAKKLDIITLVTLIIVALMFAWQRFNPVIVTSETAPIAISIEETKTGETNTKPTSIPETNENQTEAKTHKNNSIAVLPFAHRSKIEDDLYFTDGIHDDLLTQLAKIQKLNVTSRTSVMQYRDTEKSIKEIAGELNVGTILEGGIQRAGKRIRINAQLIDVSTDEHLWAETFDREMTIDDLFEIQSEITKQIVTAVKGELTNEDKLALNQAPTQSVEAYENYLKAKKLMTLGLGKNYHQQALKFINKTISLDPNFALAYITLADICGFSFWFGYDLIDNPKQQAQLALNKAKSILPESSGELLAAQGEFLYRFESNYSQALDKMLKARALIPGDSVLYSKTGHTQRRLGLWEEALESYKQSAILDPNNVNVLVTSVETLEYPNHWQRIENFLNKALLRFPSDPALLSYEALLPTMRIGDIKSTKLLFEEILPNSNLYYLLLGIEHHWNLNDYKQLIAFLNSDQLKNNHFMKVSGIGKLNLAEAYQVFGKGEDAKKAFHQLIPWLQSKLKANYSSQTHLTIKQNLAKSFAYAGENDKALNMINQVINEVDDAYMETDILILKSWILAYIGKIDESLKLLESILNKAQGNLANRWELYLDPRWNFFRDDERFNKLIKPLNFDQSIHAK
jgi:TolB-like protein/tetratricopeptide (TPR) repeat protein